jgi:hypothetical protein
VTNFHLSQGKSGSRYVSAARFDLPNLEAERVVRIRFWTFYVVLFSTSGVLGGDAYVSWIKDRPLDLKPELLVVGTIVVACFSVWLGYISARAIIWVSVPRAITIDGERILGDFRRLDWKGFSESQIRLEDIRALRKTYLLRIPMVRGRGGNYSRSRTVRDSAVLYLSASNFEHVRSALERFSAQRRAETAGPGSPREE